MTSTNEQLQESKPYCSLRIDYNANENDESANSLNEERICEDLIPQNRKSYFIEYEDSASERSEPYSKVKFSKVVQVVEYSCPTESSRVETEAEGNSDDVNEEIVNKTMIERIMEAKVNNNKVVTESTEFDKIESDDSSDQNIEQIQLDSIQNNKVSESRNKQITFRNKTAEVINIQNPIIKKEDYKPLSSLKTINSKPQKQTQFYIGSMLKKGIYRPFVSQSCNISGQRSAQRSCSNRSSRSISPVQPMRFTANCTPIKRYGQPTYIPNKNPLKMKICPSVQRNKSKNCQSSSRISRNKSKEAADSKAKATPVIESNLPKHTKVKDISKFLTKPNSARQSRPSSNEISKRKPQNRNEKAVRRVENIYSENSHSLSSFLNPPKSNINITNSVHLSVKSIKQRALNKIAPNRVVISNKHEDERKRFDNVSLPEKQIEKVPTSIVITDKENQDPDLRLDSSPKKIKEISKFTAETDDCTYKIKQIDAGKRPQPNSIESTPTENVPAPVKIKDTKSFLYKNLQQILQKVSSSYLSSISGEGDGEEQDTIYLKVEEHSGFKNSIDGESKDEINRQIFLSQELPAEELKQIEEKESENSLAYACCSMEIVKSVRLSPK